MRSRALRAWSMTALALVLLTSACGGGDDDAGGGGDKADCPLDALDSANGPVEIRFWHGMTRANEDALVVLTDQFNSSQDKVKVTLVNNNDSNDQHEKYIATMSNDVDELPDILQSQEYYLQQMVDTQTVLPVQSCIDASDTDTDDFVPRTLAYYRIQDVQWGLPFAVSEPILLYNRAAFTKAGLDPEKPPATFDELRDTAQALKDAGYEAGMALKLDPWHLEQFLALQGDEFVDNGNGREDRATAVAFDTDTAVETFTFLKGLVDDGLAITTAASGTGFDNLLSVGAGRVGMTIDSSGAYGTILDVLASGQYSDVDLAAAPVPGRTDDGGVLVGGSGLYLTARDPAKQAAAWDFAQYLTSPENQSKWAAATGFIPVRQSATELPEVMQRWQEVPGFKVAYDEIAEGAENDATAGPAIGDYKGVRDAVEEAETKMYLEGLSPQDAITQATEGANKAIDAYNSRL